MNYYDRLTDLFIEQRLTETLAPATKEFLRMARTARYWAHQPGEFGTGYMEHPSYRKAHPNHPLQGMSHRAWRTVGPQFQRASRLLSQVPMTRPRRTRPGASYSGMPTAQQGRILTTLQRGLLKAKSPEGWGMSWGPRSEPASIAPGMTTPRFKKRRRPPPSTQLGDGE